MAWHGQRTDTPSFWQSRAGQGRAGQCKVEVGNHIFHPSRNFIPHHAWPKSRKIPPAHLSDSPLLSPSLSFSLSLPPAIPPAIPPTHAPYPTKSPPSPRPCPPICCQPPDRRPSPPMTTTTGPWPGLDCAPSEYTREGKRQERWNGKEEEEREGDGEGEREKSMDGWDAGQLA